MTNSTKANISSLLIAYYSLSLMIIGTLFNLLTFFILCRPKFLNLKERPALIYIRTFVIIDVFMLFGWNFDHYTKPIYSFTLYTVTIASCKFAWFLNYFTPQTSAWLRVLISFDRYVSLTRLHRTWFSRSRNALIMISCVISFFVLLNIHLPVLACYYEVDGLINVNARSYQITPVWDWVNLAMYNCVPFVLMVTLNSGVIYRLIRIRQQTTLQNSRIHHRTVSITSIITTFLFMIMTIPATIGFAFFVNSIDETVLLALDAMLFTYHILSFPLFLITFDEFRQEFMIMICWERNSRRIFPQFLFPTKRNTLRIAS
ncbi:unnamed protein product [Adineta ricciae]|uniref:G-protein coupled receptors family 1 profile domain-containing protein n=1 Tax=Adineta ricciae TaxID=249248 RepID=A0A815ZCM2_ADIRI|nr:unnamed protein product [Adineta ricciae]